MDTIGYFTFTGIVALCIWVLSRLWELWTEAEKKKTRQFGIVRALYAEVDMSTRDFEIFINAPPDWSTLETRLKEDGYVPFISDAEHQAVFLTNIEARQELPTDLVSDIIMFYGIKESVSKTIADMNSMAFGKISASGRLNVVKRVYERCEDGAQLVQDAQRWSLVDQCAQRNDC